MTQIELKLSIAQSFIWVRVPPITEGQKIMLGLLYNVKHMLHVSLSNHLLHYLKDICVIDIDYTSIIWHNIKDFQSKVVYTST